MPSKKEKQFDQFGHIYSLIKILKKYMNNFIEAAKQLSGAHNFFLGGC